MLKLKTMKFEIRYKMMGFLKYIFYRLPLPDSQASIINIWLSALMDCTALNVCSKSIQFLKLLLLYGTRYSLPLEARP